MKPSSFAMGLLLAAAAAAQADDLTTNVSLGGSAAELSAAFGVTHIEKGSFLDTFNFTPSAGTYMVDASLVTIGFTPAADVTFTAASINGIGMTLTGPGIFEYGYLVPTAISGPLVLTVFGYVDTPDAIGLPASASYSGTLNISAVPEPAGYAMLLAGLGVAGLASRRRRN
ncbi:FxDxF family PEP-CTERM protein [Pseudoduganella violaceinigra]|uniref:FxDxF family PEP-CTERM protein n=1 Tax=Pseudoduganella violaceinigra TaxID=246602 RepID=UPI0003FDC27B|nr:FxDxF family PEP-CTERM protein [Pseudoduganella violaceinigra]